MSKPYVVKAVAEQTREWSGKGGGTFVSYSVDFEDPVGIIQQSVEWSRKPESRPPTAGEEVVGEIQEGRFGPKFKLDFEATKELQGGTRQNASQPSSRPSGGSKGSWQPESERDPERAARILRQHSQSAAIALSAVAAQVCPEKMTFGELKAQVLVLTDWLDQDANNAGQAASQGAGRAKEARSDSSPAPPDSPPAKSEPGDEEKSMLKDIDMALLEVPGADLMAADARYQIGLYMLSELQEADRDRALNQLCNKGSMEGQIATLDAMKKRTEKWTGHRLPQPVEDPLDDVPF